MKTSVYPRCRRKLKRLDEDRGQAPICAQPPFGGNESGSTQPCSRFAQLKEEKKEAGCASFYLLLFIPAILIFLILFFVYLSAIRINLNFLLFHMLIPKARYVRTYEDRAIIHEQRKPIVRTLHHRVLDEIGILDDILTPDEIHHLPKQFIA